MRETPNTPYHRFYKYHPTFFYYILEKELRTVGDKGFDFNLRIFFDKEQQPKPYYKT